MGINKILVPALALAAPSAFAQRSRLELAEAARLARALSRVPSGLGQHRRLGDSPTGKTRTARKSLTSRQCSPLRAPLLLGAQPPSSLMLNPSVAQLPMTMTVTMTMTMSTATMATTEEDEAKCGQRSTRSSLRSPAR